MQEAHPFIYQHKVLYPFWVVFRLGKAMVTKPKKVIKSYNRQIIFPAKRIETEEDLDKYVEAIRSQLKMYMQGCDGIEIK